MLRIACLLVNQCHAVIEGFSDDRHRLYNDVTTGYNKYIRPVKNMSQPLTVKIRMSYYMINELVSDTFILLLSQIIYNVNIV